ncbi:GGDEF domain-containing protein [Saccharopolyspora cebuensis]|uniref:GGDEF domain-containing protein n=1 Tax=Saccharopolyspora cebuensis TaxID=418759 RepID=UPI0031F140CD
MSTALMWTTLTTALKGTGALLHRTRPRAHALEVANAELRRELQAWQDYTADLEGELARASARAWDTVAEVPVRAVWESILDARLAAEPARTAVVWVDLDDFKRVNDRHGHLAGDAVLRAVARRLEEAFGDRSPVVTRLGGDEFGVVTRDLDTEKNLAGFVALMAEPVVLPHGRSVRVTASVGVASAAELPPGASREDVLRLADAGAYAQKASRGGEIRSAPSPRAREHGVVTAMEAAR